MLAGNYSTNAQIKNVFNFMKRAKTLREIQNLSLEFKIGSQDELGYLAPIGEFFRDDSQLVAELAKWRNANQFAYPSRFEVTVQGTTNWLASAVIENENRLLFLIQDSKGTAVGHIGLLQIEDSVCEIDNVLRGEAEPSGIMTDALHVIENFAYLELGLEDLQLRVLKSNSHAVNFYIKNGYEILKEIPLENIGSDQNIQLVESENNVIDHFLLMHKNLTETKPIQSEILTAGPSISNRELTYVADAALHGWNSNHSYYLNKFQEEFAEYVGAKHAIATSSCTGALHLSLLALGIGPGDEVIVPEVTWVATASAVRYTGATPIFADINEATWCISPESFESKITSRTKAVMPVHLYGFGADMSAIASIATKYGIKIVEDAAPAIGTLIDNKPAGSFGDFGAYSFQGAKMLVTGEGGMLVTSDSDLYEKAKKIQDHGRKPGTFWIEEVGYKYKMNNVTAALGLAQLERSERQIEQKRRIATWYKELLEDHPSLKMQFEDQNTRSIHWMNSIMLGDDVIIQRDELMEKLKSDGIDTRPVFPAISQYPIWDIQHDAGTIATKVGARSINLPSGVNLSRQSVEKICRAILSLI